MVNKAMDNMKRRNDISVDINKLVNLSDLDCLESKTKVEEIHSIAWEILLKAERMLRFLSEQEKFK